MGHAGRMITCAGFNEDRNETSAQTLVHLLVLIAGGRAE